MVCMIISRFNKATDALPLYAFNYHLSELVSELVFYFTLVSAFSKSICFNVGVI